MFREGPDNGKTEVDNTRMIDREEIMKKKGIYGVWIYGTAICAAAATLLAGCGDGSGTDGKSVSSEVGVVTAEPVLSDAERALYDYEQKYASGEFTAEDFQALAGLYAEKGLIRKQRDMLEQSYRLHQDPQAFEALQTIAVNLAEEDAGIAAEAELLLQNLELPEYFAEAIHQLENKSWMDIMMPKLSEGKRNYFLGRDGQAVLSIQVGYDGNGKAFSHIWYLGSWMDIMMPKLSEGKRNYFLGRDGQAVLSIQVGYDGNGKAFSHIWYLGSEGQITYLHKAGSTIEVLTTALAEGAYDGAFDLWTLDEGTGNVYREQGTFAKGIFTGDYTMSAHAGTAAGSAFDLWNNRETFAYTDYKGSFDAEGRAAVEQPSEAEMEKLLQGSTGANVGVKGIVYAYAENGKDCLFVSLKEGEEAADYVFSAASTGIQAYPDFAFYEAEEDTDAENGNTGDDEAVGTEKNDGTPSGETADGAVSEDVSKIPVRIFDGEVQLYDGKKWVSVGNVNSLLAEDPFGAYGQQKDEQSAGQNQNGNAQNGENGQTGTNAQNGESGTDRFQTGTIEEENTTPPANKPANKPSNNKPAVNKPTKPATPPTTPAPQPAPTPTPDPAPSNPAPAPTPRTLHQVIQLRLPHPSPALNRLLRSLLLHPAKARRILSGRRILCRVIKNRNEEKDICCQPIFCGI